MFNQSFHIALLRHFFWFLMLTFDVLIFEE